MDPAPSLETEIEARGKTSASLTPWGWTYLMGGPTFAAGYLLGGLDLIPLVLWAAFGLGHAAMLRWNLSGLAFSARFESERCTVGGILEGTLHAARRRRPGSAHSVRVFLREQPNGLTEPLFLARIPRVPMATRFRLIPNRFGRCAVALVALESAFPFRLWTLAREVSAPRSFHATVWPPRRRLPLRLQQIENDRSPKRGAIIRSLPERGLEIRPFSSGDSPRDICWKSTARLGHLQVRPRPVAAIRPRVLVIQPERTLWKKSSDFWKMVVVAFELVQRAGDDRSLRAVRIGDGFYPLRTRGERLLALDAIACLRPAFGKPPPIPPIRGMLRLRPAPDGGLTLVDERQRELHRVS